MANKHDLAGRVPFEISAHLLQQNAFTAIVYTSTIGIEQYVRQSYGGNGCLFDYRNSVVAVPVLRLSAQVAVMVTVFRCSVSFEASN